MGSSETRWVPRDQASISLTKAREFLATANDAITTARWNAAGLAAIHAGICSGDTALIATAGVRSVAKDHGALIGLLGDLVPEFSASQQRQLSGVLKMKNRVAYEQRLVTEVEARQLVDQAGRLVRWAERVFRSSDS